MSESALLNNSKPIEPKDYPIVFISDLHFDYTKGKPNDKAATQMKDDFISFIKERYADSVLCLAGDYYDDYRKTLAFVKELEHNQIVGFFVLGNHDYWNNGTKSHADIISLFDTETQGNQYFRFLITGREYYLGDICFIGDTGWTSFQRGKHRVDLNQFLDLPDALNVKDFSPKKIVAMHEEWISYANSILNQEEKVLILTHFPMVNFTKSDYGCWWSSQTELKGENSWRIFGHTHNYKEQKYNNISLQRNYDNRDSEHLKLFGRKQYSSYDFGILEKVTNKSELVATSNYQSITNFYSSELVSDASQESTLVTTVKRRGYIRCAANKKNLAALANSPESYLKAVKHMINWYLRDSYIGYSRSDRISKRVFESIFSSVEFLENGNYNDKRAFMTAAVITGYVYNLKPFLIEDMRPLDDYDIIRFWLMFLTIKQYGIDKDVISTVRKNSKKPIVFRNVDIYLPAVNGVALNLDEVQKLTQQTPILSRPVALLEQHKREDISENLEQQFSINPINEKGR